MTFESHPSLDGDIETWPHEGALFEGQRLQDLTHVLMCVVQEEWQMHNTSAQPSIVAQHPSVECRVVNAWECMNYSNQT